MKHLLLALLATHTLLAPAPRTDSDNTEADTSPIRVGVTLSLSGKFEQESKEVRAGYDLWEKMINAAGGIRIKGIRRKVTLIYADDQSSPELSAEVTEKNLIRFNKVQFLLSSYASQLTMGIARVARKYKIPLIASVASSDELFKSSSRYVFGVHPPASRELESTLATLQAAGAKTVTLMYTDDPYAQEIAKSVPRLCKEHGLTLLEEISFPAFSPTVEQDPLKQIEAKNLFKKLLSAIEQNPPDVLIGAGHYYDSERFVWALQELSFNPRALVLTTGPSLPLFVKRQGAAANGIICPVAWNPALPYHDDFIGSAQDYSERFEDLYGYKPTFIAATATAAGLVLQRALEQAGTTETTKVLAKLRTFDQETFFGRIKFDEAGKNIGTPMAVLQIQNGKKVLVGKFKAANQKLIYPKPAWPKQAPD